MTLTTTTVNGCDAGIWFDNAAGVLKDLSGSSNAFTLEITQNVGEQRVFGSSVRTNTTANGCWKACLSR